MAKRRANVQRLDFGTFRKTQVYVDMWRTNAGVIEFWKFVKIIRPVAFWDVQSFEIIIERLDV